MKYLGKFKSKENLDWAKVNKGYVYNLYEFTEEEIKYNIKCNFWAKRSLTEGVITTHALIKINDGIFKPDANKIFDLSKPIRIDFKKLVKKAKEIRRLGEKLLEK